MPKIVCYVAEINLYHSLPVLDEDLRVSGRTVSDYFRQPSGPTDEGSAIEISIDWSRRDIVAPSSDYGVDDGKLRDALERLLAPGAPNGAIPVGLILANFYTQAGSAYGYMFDTNWHTSVLGPRQGCALFLNQIRNATGTDDQAFRERAVFTAIHEMGHMFNLWHVEDTASFMKPPPVDDILGACSFVPEHQHYLQAAADPAIAPFVMPGMQSSDFGSRAPGFPSGADSFYAPVTGSQVELKIGLSHREFWHFEPIELEVEIGVAKQETQRAVIPEEIDPGYSRFEIWVTRPDGERRRYLPSRRFCGNSQTLEITPEKPFRRDISIFRQSGGFTFAMVGRYQVQAILRLSAEKKVASNVVECDVLKARPDLDAYTAAHRALSSLEAAKLLHYRSRTPARRELAALRAYVEAHQASPSAAAVHYSLGKVFLAAAAATRETKHSVELRTQGQYHLAKIDAHSRLGTHRTAKVKTLLVGHPG